MIQHTTQSSAVHRTDNLSLYNAKTKFTVMPSKRTGIMPLKKKFTAVGGVGARHIAMQNKISRQAPRVATSMVASVAVPAPPVLEPLNNLFNIDSFHPKNQYTPLDPSYRLALIAATDRWNKLLSFHPDGLNAITQAYKERFGKEWKGFELLSVSYRTNPNQIATTEIVKITGTNIPYGFRLRINRAGLTNGILVDGINETFTQENIEHVFAHELGHALGLCATISPEDVVRLPYNQSGSLTHLNHQTYYNRVGGNPSDGTSGRAILGQRLLTSSSSSSPGTFPQTHLEHSKLLQSATARLAFGPTHILLSDDEWHWEKKMVTHEVYAWDPPTQTYKMIGKRSLGNFENEIITSGFNPHYDNEFGYLISNKSLKYLTEIRPFELQMYVEKTLGASEVSDVIKYGASPNVTHILKGKAGVIAASRGIVPTITVERHLSPSSHDAYTVVYLEGDTGVRNEEEIIQLVRNHERIVNDPAYFEFKCGH
jgi:hypothetical protein